MRDSSNTLRQTLKRSAAVLAAAGLLTGAVSAFATTTIIETGSSLLYPLFNLWVPDYTGMNDVHITTAATGSGTGIAQSTQGIATIGASDAYLSDGLMKKYPGMLNIPVAISSQMVNYNVPGANGEHLKLSGPVIADIYGGRIKYWNDKRIERMNPGVKLPHHIIIPVHRSDGSGDTFIFSQFLSKSTPWWSSKVGYGTTVNWPAVPGEIGAVANSGMVTAVKNNPYTIAYIGVSYKKQTDGAGLGEAKLKNRSGYYVLPNVHTVPAAAGAMVPKTPADERISLIFAPGAKSYPIINYEYCIVKAQQPDATTAAALKKLLTWAVSPDGGNSAKYLVPVHFMPLPPKARHLTLQQIDKIHS